MGLSRAAAEMESGFQAEQSRGALYPVGMTEWAATPHTAANCLQLAFRLRGVDERQPIAGVWDRPIADDRAALP